MISGVTSAEFELYTNDYVGLAGKFAVNPSSCGNSDFYEQYLKFSAINDQRKGATTTHVFLDQAENRIMGFTSLRASSIISKGENGLMEGEPALEVYMLAVDKDYEGRGVGKALIAYVLAEAALLHEKHMGVRYVILAADPMAVGFYEKMGFDPLERFWSMPKEQGCANCRPMFRDLQFELETLEPFPDDDDDDE